MRFERSSGILTHISTLPSRFGIGDIGPEAYKFADWLKTAHQTVWQILPFSLVDENGCPYSSASAYGANPLLISPEKLVEDGLLKKSDLGEPETMFGAEVDYALVQEYKAYIHRKAYDRFVKKSSNIALLEKFSEEESTWLDDLTIFLVISEQLGSGWVNWPTKLRNRDKKALKAFKEKNEEQINYHKFLQYIFFKQWGEFKAYVNAQGIKLIGDIPIFLSHQSMDVWKDQDHFVLAGGLPYVVTGAPPDTFSATGQKWGNPNYNWWRMEQDGFQWWINRIAFNKAHYDIIRLDHFRGFAATWEIPADNPDPCSGYWSEVPGHNLFHCLGNALGYLPLIAEDLGKITPDVCWLRDRFDFTGMKVLQFAFSEGDYSEHLPHNYHTNNCVVYTGTHDNPTSNGWFWALGDTLERSHAIKYTGAWNFDNFNWSLIHLAMHTRADMAITPLQDIMGLGNEARFNKPGVAKGNWAWRFKWEDLRDADKHHLSELTFNSWRNRWTY